ncbi:MAG: hypothetical protein LUC27_03730, partial [Lachnospiraceae bacterium]|nr:hypothetical protein [Lachnospiraceae bacterium]
ARRQDDSPMEVRCAKGESMEVINELYALAAYITDNSRCAFGQSACTVLLAALRLFPEEFEVRSAGQRQDNSPTIICCAKGESSDSDAQERVPVSDGKKLPGDEKCKEVSANG